MLTDIQQSLDALATAWNTGDAVGYADQFTEDADYITFFGMHMCGRAAIEDSHRHLFDGPLKGSQMTAVNTARIRRLSSDVALIVAGGETTAEGSADGRESVVSFTAVREADTGRWRFASFQNTRCTAVPGRPQ